MRVRAIGRLREARGWTRAELPEAVDVALRYLRLVFARATVLAWLGNPAPSD